MHTNYFILQEHQTGEIIGIVRKELKTMAQSVVLRVAAALESHFDAEIMMPAELKLPDNSSETENFAIKADGHEITISISDVFDF